MFQDFYQLADQPFGVTPDPRYLYLGKGHREAMASVMYGVNAGRGFSALIARPGMGKTTLLFNLLQNLEGNAQTVFLFQSQCSPQDLLRSLLADLGIEQDAGDVVRMQSKLNEFLLRESKRGKRFVVVVDEAQNLDEPVLEVLRMLSNFETSREKLMHIILAGQPQLAARLSSPGMTQLRQRISIIARLSPLNVLETRAYIDHRLRVAGYNFSTPLFSDPVYELMAKYSEGIPRNINNLCFNVMSLGCALKKKTIPCGLLREVVEDLNLSSLLEEPAAGSAHEALQPATVRHTESRGTKWFQAWPWKVSAVGAVGLALAISAVPTSQRSGKTPLAEVAQAAIELQQPSLATAMKTEPQPTAEVKPAADNKAFRLVEVKPNETVIGICRSAFGKYDEEILEKVKQLNPSLQDLSYIRSGTTIRIPDIGDSAKQIQTLPEHRPAAPAADVEKP